MPAFHGFITTNTTMRTMVIILHECSIAQLICSSKIMGGRNSVSESAHHHQAAHPFPGVFLQRLGLPNVLCPLSHKLASFVHLHKMCDRTESPSLARALRPTRSACGPRLRCNVLKLLPLLVHKRRQIHKQLVQT